MAQAPPPEAYSPEQMSGSVEFELNPQQLSEGFLMEGGIADIALVQQDSYRGGQTEVFDYEMADGHHYRVYSNRPNDLRSDIGVVSTTPWTTRAGGFNAKNMFELNDLGYQTDFVEPHGKAIRASLPDSARNLELIAGDRHAKTDVRPDESLYFGASRAAAIGFGVKSAVYADLLAPCFPSNCRPEQLPVVATQLGIEALELGKHMAQIGFDSITRQHSTFSKHPKDALQSVLAIPQLINGDAGKMAWSNPDTPTHITVLDKDGWSRIAVWEEMAKDLGNLHISQVRGRHMTLAHPAIVGAVVERFDVLAEMRGFDGEFNEEIFAELAKIQPPEPKKALGGLSVGKLIKAGFNLAAAH